jgi:sugar lactone lactonase YvrE
MVILVVAIRPPLASAEPTAYFSGPLSGGENGLLRIDLADGQVTEIGPFGPGGVWTNAIAFAPDGTLYGIAVDVGGGGRLVNVDAATGAATLLTELTLLDPFNYLGSMAVDACGRLFAGGLTGVLGGELRDKVFAVDPGTGTIQEIASGADGFGPVSLAARGETLFTVHQGVLSILEPATGEITPIGGTLPNADFDFAPDGFLWGALSATGIPVPGPSGTINQIDPNTGEIVSVGQHDRIMNGGIAIGPPPGVCGATPLAIPTVSAPGLVALAILLGAGGLILARRRAARTPHVG